MEPKTRIADIGFERVLMPGDKRIVQVQPQALCRVTHLFIERRENIMLDEVNVGNQKQQAVDWSSVSTLFYSLPSSPKTLDRIRALIREVAGKDPPYDWTNFAWDEAADPDVIMGLPVTWDTAKVGNVISLCFTNRGAEPARVTGVMRATVAVY